MVMVLHSIQNCLRLAGLTPARTVLCQQIMQSHILTHKVVTSAASVASSQVQQRPFFLHWINSVFNQVSRERVEEVGPDRACAEWLLRNGALVQWMGANDFVTDYNELPLDKKERGRYFIKAVDATDSSVMSMGFPHFEGCNHIEKITFKKCKYLDSEALPLLSVLKKSLNTLEVIYCWNLTAESILSLRSLSNLKTLKLEGLPEVKNKSEVLQKLQQALPNCVVTFDGEGVAVNK
ncbi:ATP synthase subunit s, mitochondrial [Thrips palmi]|uniref:ATP synthase subunit s, mitochondrial n=1 Tax=Thrips palmi TaxID=161013 RepID=A0A6P9A510_THRPL|nr:ATP synthase subunit s, mitochondrial [Thrips palmi]XP_034252964.1 ATP synthase subunit s, mitochondrial [Thrips palmi]